MSIEAEFSTTNVSLGSKRGASRLFHATIGRFNDATARAAIDALAQWVEKRFEEDLRQRPSKHVYVRNLPTEVVEKIDLLRDSNVVRQQILKQFDANSVIVPMKHTDELYISHYNKDYGGDHGLFSKHYDGNLRFLRFGSVVRALIYLRSNSTYTVVFGNSKVRKAFETYDFGLLDFHRELHWVEGEYNPDDEQRVLLKCNFLITPKNAGWLGRTIEAVNTGVFYIVKAAMEYSKSPRTPLQYMVGATCNLFRLMNNVHPLIPLAFILLSLCSLFSLAFFLVRMF